MCRSRPGSTLGQERRRRTNATICSAYLSVGRPVYAQRDQYVREHPELAARRRVPDHPHSFMKTAANPAPKGVDAGPRTMVPITALRGRVA